MEKYRIAAVTTTVAPPEYIWSVLDDFGGWPGWMPAMKNLQVEHFSLGKPRCGYRFRLRGKIAYADLEVTSYKPFERATKFRLNVPPLTGANTCRITPLGSMMYRLERIDYIDLPGPLIKVLDATQRQRFELLAAEFLDSLKQTAENRSGYAALRTTL